MEATVYRPPPRLRLAAGATALLSGLSFVAVGVAGITVIGWNSWAFCGTFAALGAIAIVAGWAVLRVRITIDAAGIRKIFWTTEFVAWDAVQAWVVTPSECDQRQREAMWAVLYGSRAPAVRPPQISNDESFTFQALLLRVEGRQRPVEIYDSEAFRPSFAALIDDVRARIGDKEIVIEGAKAATAK